VCARARESAVEKGLTSPDKQGQPHVLQQFRPLPVESYLVLEVKKLPVRYHSL